LVRTAACQIGAQRNFTDPDCRIRPLRSKARIAGYNALTAVDGGLGSSSLQRLQPSSADRDLPARLVDIANPKGGFRGARDCDERNVHHLARRRIDGFLAPGRARYRESHAAGLRQWSKASRKATTVMKLKRAGRRSRHRSAEIEMSAQGQPQSSWGA
jgi:hypothetical protein